MWNLARPQQAQEGFRMWERGSMEGVGARASARWGLGMDVGVGVLPGLGGVRLGLEGAGNPLAGEGFRIETFDVLNLSICRITPEYRIGHVFFVPSIAGRLHLHVLVVLIL